jgi:hypothetical protein
MDVWMSKYVLTRPGRDASFGIMSFAGTPAIGFIAPGSPGRMLAATGTIITTTTTGNGRAFVRE